MSQTGVIMLGMFRSEQEVGYYSVAVKLATLTTFMLAAINSMSASKFSELFCTGQIDDLFFVAKKSAKLIFWTTTPILLCLVLFGKFIISILFGKEFIAAFPAMIFLAIGQFANSISGSTGMFMNMTKHQKVFRNIMLLATIINIVVNLLLIPSVGIIGAGIAAMVSTGFWNSVTLLYIKRTYGKLVGYVPFLP
jgi:O-antigen/teichoic acid export membrane protein